MNQKLQKFIENFKKNKILYIFILFLVITTGISIIFLKNYIEKIKQERLEKQNTEISYFQDLIGGANNINGCNELINNFKKIKKSQESYLQINSIKDAIKYCDENILTLNATFSTGVFFNPENNFASVLNINFSNNFYEDKGEINSSEFLENRIKAKKLLHSLLTIEPKIDFSIDDIVFYPNRAILYLKLKELTEYKVSIKNHIFENQVKLKENSILFKTPESKFLKLKIENPVSLYRDITPPKFSLIEYESNLNDLKVKICRVDNETFAKIETLRFLETQKESQDFFINGIDKIKTFECKTKTISINKNQNNYKTFFDFDDVIGNPARSGLYFVTFEDKNLRNFNNNIALPLFFGIIDSHLTMKISKNGEGFFFVNDFDGKPLANQTIRAYINDFQAFKSERNNEKQDYETKFFTILDKNILSKEIILGKTGKDGILKVNLSDKIQNVFDLTFEDRWTENYDGKYPSLFITSASDTNLTYNSSRWNAGIAPFNFGYKINDDWWGGWEQNSNTQNKEIELNRGQEYPKYLSHTYTDRILYLPGEQVNIKSIIRGESLKPATNKKFIIKINDPKGQEVLSKELNTNDFGSIWTSYNLPLEAKLGSYYVYIMDGDKNIGNTSFSVEIFQNPKFKNEITLKTDGLVGDFFKVTDTEKINDWNTEYSGYFTIKASVISKYYNGSPLKNASISYKVYKQPYYDYSYWDDCYYGCYWEPEKEFYTEGISETDENGFASFDIKVDHKTSYDDYKYIVEATITDEIGDEISTSNSIIVKLPNEYKKWNSNSNIIINTKENFYKSGENINIIVGLSGNSPWTDRYNDKFLLTIKKKIYKTEFINDVKGYKRPINTFEEKIIDTILINSKNGKIIDGKLNLDYKINGEGEYVFEYGKVETKNNSQTQKSYFSVIIYSDINATHPIIDDNKVQILSNKVSYKIGEKARFLIRLPVSKGKILWTIEKAGVEKSEYIDVKSNIFFKEIIVDDSFLPNAYISALLVDTQNLIPEYKVGYTEIVVDKTDKKSFIDIKTNKKEYFPREEVKIDLFVKDKNGKGIPSEISVMVVDDSLISLMGNVDLNLIDKFFKKLPFQIQTSLTNVVMLSNYYFSRPGIVGGGGFGSFKGGDSAVSTRNIFKNTAYYNPSIITDASGKASVKFNLPDNLTNFRIIAISNSKNNFFGTKETFINVRKNVIIEPKTPIIIRNNDKLKIDANIFNTTSKEIGFKVSLTSDSFNIKNPTTNITIGPNSSKIVSFEIQNKNILNKDLYYTISALGDSVSNSDKFEGIIKLASDPILLSYSNKEITLDEKNKYQSVSLKLPKNTDLSKSKIILKISNNRLSGVEKIVSSLAVYPYGCVEQTTSSTFPNAIVKNFSNIFSGIIDEKEIDKNINAGIKRIKSMQQDDGGFAYWPGDTNSELSITPYVYRNFYEIQKLGYKDLDDMLNKSKIYLENNLSSAQDDTIKSQIYWALSLTKSNKIIPQDIISELKKDLNNISRIAYTYALINLDKIKYKTEINNSINKLKSTLEKEDSSYRYWDALGNKAIFTQMLLDFDYDLNYIDTLINDLYNRDWMNYYYSTQTKNSAFFAFYKYIQKTGVNNFSKVNYTFKNNKGFALVGEENPAIFKKEIISKEVFNGNDFKIDFELEKGKRVYIDMILESYPEDIKKIKPYSNKIKITREIFEIGTGKEKEEKKVSGNTFKKGKLYRVVLNVETDNKETRNLVIEDYLPSGFKPINERLKIKSNTANNRNDWYFDYKEIRPEVVFLNSSYSYGKLSYTYLFSAEYAGTFTYPPVSAYIMYDPEKRAHGEYRVIEIVE